MSGLAASEKKSSRFVISVFWNALGVMANLAAGLLLSPYLIRKLGPDGYGVWALSFVLVEYYWLLDLGFRSATVKYVAHYWTLKNSLKVSQIMSTSLLYSTCAASLILFAVAAAAPRIQQAFQIAPAYELTFQRLVLITTASWCMSIVLGAFGAALEAVQRFDLSTRASIVNTVIRTVGTFVLLYFGYGLIEIGLLAAFGQAVMFGLQYFAFRRVFPNQPLGPRYASIPVVRQMMSFGIHTFAVNVSQQLLTQSAPLLIGHFHPASFVGFYSLPVRLLQYTVELVARIGLVTNSSAAALSARNDQNGIVELAIYSNRYCLALFVPIAIFLTLFGDRLFLLWVGPAFAPYSSPVLPVLLLGSMIAIVGQFSSTMLLQGLAKHQIYARGLMVEAVLGIAALWFVIPKYGIMGAAWVSTSFMLANRCFFISWLTSRVAGLSFLGFLSSVYSAALVTSIPVWAIAWWLRSTMLPGATWAQLAAAGLVSAVLYYAAAFVFVMPPEHRQLVFGWTARFTRAARSA